MKNKKYQTVAKSLSWLGTGISIKMVGLKHNVQDYRILYNNAVLQVIYEGYNYVETHMLKTLT
jgi:hypothetical protein